MNLFILPSWYPTKLYPESGTFFREWASLLNQNEFDVKVINATIHSLWDFPKITKISKSPFQFEDILGFPTLQIEAINLSPKYESGAMAQQEKIWNKIFQEGIDRFGRPDSVLIYSSVWAGVSLVNTLQKLNIPFGVTEHMKEFLLPNGFTLNQMKAINYCYDKATFISGTSSALTNKMKSLFPKFKNKITTIPNPIDTNIFKPHKEFLQSSNLPFRFIACGLFREEKEFPLLLKAFHQLSQSNDCTLTLVGKGQFEPLLKSIVKELNLESRVTFTGYLSQRDWIKQLCQSHALVLSSSVETFGMVVVEAMACGIPVVATRCGGPEYTIKNNLGILVEPLNFKSLANGMQKMIHEYSQFDPKFIREDVKNRFSTTVHTQSIKKLFRTF